MEGASEFWSTFIPPTCTEHFLGISWFVSNSTTEINWEDFTQMLFWGNSLTSSIANSFFLQLFILFSATYEGSPDTVLDSAKGKKKKTLKIKNYSKREISLVVQWLRIHLAMQGTCV